MCAYYPQQPCSLYHASCLPKPRFFKGTPHFMPAFFSIGIKNYVSQLTMSVLHVFDLVIPFVAYYIEDTKHFHRSSVRSIDAQAAHNNDALNRFCFWSVSSILHRRSILIASVFCIGILGAVNSRYGCKDGAR